MKKEVENLFMDGQRFESDKENFENTFQTNDGLFFIYYFHQNEDCLVVAPKFTFAAPLFLEDMNDKYCQFFSNSTKPTDPELFEESSKRESRRIRRVLSIMKKDSSVNYFGPLLIEDLTEWLIRLSEPSNELLLDQIVSPTLSPKDYQELAIVDFANNVFFDIAYINRVDKTIKLPNTTYFDGYMENERLFLFKKFEEGQSVFEGESDIHQLEKCIKDHSLPIIIEYHKKYKDDMFKCGYENLLYIKLNRTPKVDYNLLMGGVKKCVELLKNKIMFVVTDFYNEDDMQFLASALRMKGNSVPNDVKVFNQKLEGENFHPGDKFSILRYPDEYVLQTVIEKLAGKFENSDDVKTVESNIQVRSFFGRETRYVLLCNKSTNEIFGYIEEDRVEALVNCIDFRNSSIKDEEKAMKKMSLYETSDHLKTEKLLQSIGSQLVHLDYNDSLNILPKIGYHCRNLELFNIEMSTYPTRELINTLWNMKKLKAIEISRIFQNENESTVAVLNSIPWSIKKIEITSDFFPSIERLHSFMFSEFTSLHWLTLQHYELDRSSMEEIGKLITLVHLCLDYCVIKRGLESITNLKSLDSLSLVHVDSVDDDFLIDFFCKVRYVRRFNISFCTSVTRRGFWDFFKLFNPKSLRHLEIMGTSVRDAEIGLLKNLTHLFCDDCKGVSDLGVLKVVQNSPELQYLGLVGTCVTFNTIEFLDRFLSYRTNNIVLNLKVNHSVNLSIFDRRINIRSPLLKVSTFKNPEEKKKL